MGLGKGTLALTLTAHCLPYTSANPLNPRQDSSSVLSSSSSSKPSTSISGSTSARAAATPTGTASKTTSTPSASESTFSGTLTPSSTAGSAGPEPVTIFRSLPSFTETVSHAYKAHGVNATFNSTFSHTGTVTTGTATDLSPGAILGTTAGPQPTGKDIGEIPDDKIACRVNGTDPKQGPFCTPEYDQNLWVNNVYAVTWNPDLFSSNATNHIEIHNANSTDPENSLIYNSTATPNRYGFLNIYMNHDWLGDHSGNFTRDGVNMTFKLISEPIGAPLNDSTLGPITTLTLNPDSVPRIIVPNPVPVKKGLEIGLPIGLIAFVIIALSIWCGIRKHRQKWSVVRHYGKDYMRKRARRKGKKDVIELSDYDFDSSTRAERFEDEPTVGGEGGRNEFRDEMERQREQAYRDRAQKITSF